jgi:hypothetical protein
MRVVVTASGLTAWKSATSSGTAAVAAIPVANAQTPAISGTPQEGQVLHVSDGVWSGSSPIMFAYQWYRCADGTCTAIADATTADYALAADDIGSTMKAAVTATNAAGSATADSAESAVTTGNAPVSDSPPAVTGTPEVGQTLAADPGTWHGTAPIGVAYQWMRCDDSGDCTTIEGATTESYVVAPEDVGFSLAVVVTATNVSGSISVASVPTGVVVEPPLAG